MDLIAFNPPPGTWRAIDTAGDDRSPGNVVTRALAQELRKNGYWAVARYTRPDGRVLANPRAGGDYNGCWSLSLAEQRWILEAGLAIMPVQFGVFGDAQYGIAKGQSAADAAVQYGWPKGITHFLDVEGSGPQMAGAKNVTKYVEAWAAINNGAGYRTGIYLTGQVPLTAHQLYGLVGVSCYWSAAGPIPPNPLPRGYAVEQDPPTTVCGIACDTDTIRTDRMGQGPVLIATVDIAAAWYGHALADMISPLASW